MENRSITKKREKIIRGLEFAYKKLVDFKKSKNSPIIVAKDGKIIELDPKEALPTTIYKWH